MVGFELADKEAWEAAKVAATKAYREKVRLQRLSRFSPTPATPTQGSSEPDSSLPTYTDFVTSPPAPPEPELEPVIVDPAELRRLAAEAVPLEPSVAEMGVIQIQFRGLDERRIRRNFVGGRDTVKDLVNFAHSHGCPPTTHDVLIPMPRQVFGRESWGSTLTQVGLGKRVVLQVEER